MKLKKQKQIIKVLPILLLIFTAWANISKAQLPIPTLVSSQKYLAKGSGTTGVPTVSFNVPAGHKDMLLRVSYLIERYNPTGNNYPSINGNERFTQINIGGNTNAVRMESMLGEDSPFAMLGEGFFLSQKDGLTSGAVDITFPQLQIPKHANDEIMVYVTLYENVKEARFFTRLGPNFSGTPLSSYTATAPAPTPPLRKNSRRLFIFRYRVCYSKHNFKPFLRLERYPK